MRSHPTSKEHTFEREDNRCWEKGIGCYQHIELIQTQLRQSPPHSFAHSLLQAYAESEYPIVLTPAIAKVTERNFFVFSRQKASREKRAGGTLVRG